MLKETIDFEKNIRSCGTPDCRSTCMQEPLFNEGSSYNGCWNQAHNGNKCMNWNVADNAFGTSYGLGDNNYCRDPDGKGQAWCFLEDQSEGHWDYCVDTTDMAMGM